MRDYIAWLYLVALMSAAYPMARGIVGRLAFVEATYILTPTLTLALSIGLLSGIMLYLGIFNIQITLISVVLPYLSLLFIATLVFRSSRTLRTAIEPRLQLHGWQLILIALISVIAAAVLFNAVYFPLYRDDTLGIYRPAALPIFYDGHLDPLIGADSLYRTYPVLIPSMYALGYLAAGWENDYLAKLIPTLLSIGCLPAAYLLGVEFARTRKDRVSVGLIAAALLAITPNFARWASSGYVDLPMAFFLTVAIFFMLRLARSRTLLDALLAGALFGCALLTKNAALFAVPICGIGMLLLLLRRTITLQHSALFVASCAIIGAPFYIRNLIGAGFIIPNTAWVDQAQPSLANLFVFVTKFDTFGLTGIIITLAVIITPLAMLRHIGQPKWFSTWIPAVSLFGFIVPYFGVWWLLVSYDPRFLLLFLPLLTVITADIVIKMNSKVLGRLHLVAFGVVIMFGVVTLYHSVEYKDEILRDPFMTHTEKLVLVGRLIPPP